MQVLKKWLYCSWKHKRDRCYPTVWGQKKRKEWVSLISQIYDIARNVIHVVRD